MKLLVVANSPEYGKSGVADYALTLSSQLRNRGIDVAYFAYSLSSSSSEAHLLELTEHFQPDWISLHFVPYAYAQRGLVGRHTLPWSILRGRTGTHIFFHEIWIGVHVGASWRHRMIGSLQRRGIKQAMQLYRPDLVHCTNSLYSAMLHDVGIPNHVLPLFGTVPSAGSCIDPYSELAHRFLPRASRSDWIVATLFGAIHSRAKLLDGLKWLFRKSRCNGKHLMVVSIGHSPSASYIFKSLSSYFSPSSNPFFHVQGKVSSTSLSSWISSSDCGISTTPYNIIEKSSSAVSFAEHGVPVIVVDAGAPVRGISISQSDLTPDFWLLGDQRLEAFSMLPPRRPPKSRMDSVVNQFLLDINANGR